MSLGADYERLLDIFRGSGLDVRTDPEMTFIEVLGSRFCFDARGELTGGVVLSAPPGS